MYKIAIIITTLILAIGLPISYAADDPTLAGLWLFDEDGGDVVADSSGNGNDGVMSGAEWTDGKFGSALQFTGTGCVTVPHAESLSIEEGAISITAWITQDGSASGWCTVICKGPFADTTENYAVFSETGLAFICTTLTMDSGERWWTTSGDGSLPIDSEWHHFATTYDGEELKYYLDGEEVAVYAKTGDLTSNEEDLTIGCRSNDGTNWGGILDELALFSRALTEEEVKSIMDNGLEGFLVVEPSGKLATTWGEIRE